MVAADVAFEDVTKRYKVPPESGSSSDGFVARMKRRYLTPPNLFTAVRNLSFEVPHGQALGIIGHNGAGKSTILKLLSGITTPTEGLITVRGRVAALLEVGSGFHPELTGRENIFLSGSLLGMTRREIHRKLESIIDFAEIRSFVDVPVKRYSSGMYVRLGFSIAAHLEPDVLLLDEVLAVGDATFQQKSKQRILELKQASTTIIFISHDLHAVQQVCDRVLVIRKGVMIYDGDPHSAIVAYEKSGSDHIAPAKTVEARKPVSIVSMDLLDASGRPARGISTGSPLRVRVHYCVHVPVSGIRLLAVFHTPDWQMKCSFTTAQRGEELDLPPGECAVEFACDELALQPGLYMLDAVVERAGLVEPVDWIPDCKVIQVTEGPARAPGSFYHSHSWSFLTPEETSASAREDLSNARCLDSIVTSANLPAVYGHGNWEHYALPLDGIYAAAAEWKEALKGVERPWLCWNVSPRWCVLQQRLVKEAGWTPVVGYDPRSGPPPVVPGGVLIDFNRTLQFPVMFFMFPLEFVFLFAPRLAFWHADLLCRMETMNKLARIYNSLRDGEMAAVPDMGGRRYLFSRGRHRYWELAGCTTERASRDQFEKGAGWWRSFNFHPNCPDAKERAARDRCRQDFGFGIMYWKRRYGRKVIEIAQRPLVEGHCTSIGKPNYRRVGPEGDARNLGAEIDLNYNIEEVAARLDILRFLPTEP